MYRLKNNPRVVYRCAIALQLSAIWKLPSPEIAHQLVCFLPTVVDDLGNNPELDFTVKVVDPGWI
ncbi:MAG: anticodon-binding protein, partial [Moorea sp. SIO2B7]|nr:anticodon-binding protein [Moorena sp. SIO2B7]